MNIENLTLKSMEHSTILIIFLLLIILILLKILRKREKLPPGPRWRLPVLGHLHLIDRKRPLHHSLLSICAKHGPVVLLHLGSSPTLVVSSHGAAREIFTRHDPAIFGRPRLTALVKLSYSCSSITSNADRGAWRQARRIVADGLLGPCSVRGFAGLRRREVMRLVATAPRDGGDMGALILSFVNRVVCRAALGDEFSARGVESLRPLLAQAQALLAGFFFADFFPQMGWLDRLAGNHGRLEEFFRELDAFLDGFVRERLQKMQEAEEEEEVEKAALADLLLRKHQAEARRGSGGYLSSIDHVKAILTEILVAGTDTSAATITWTMAELMRNPSVMKKLREELKQTAVAANGGRHLIEERDLERLKYLRQVVKESLRLRPPVPMSVPRETLQPCDVWGYAVPAKTLVLFNVAAIHADPAAWERPSEFRPERFDEKEVEYLGQDFEYLPFGSGRRRCPGISFSAVLVKLALANLVHCLDWSMPEGMKPEDIDMEEAAGITTHMKYPLRLVAKPRLF